MDDDVPDDGNEFGAIYDLDEYDPYCGALGGAFVCVTVGLVAFTVAGIVRLLR